MPAPIALQLYTLREAAAVDFEATVRKVADIGYVGVEPAGFPGTTVEAGKRLFDDLGLQVCSAHLPLPVGATKQQSLDTAAALGVSRVVAGQGPDQFTTRDQIKASCDKFNEASANCAEKGLAFAIHNHWWEFLEVDGELVYQQMLKHLSAAVLFEVDAYWVQTAGPNPAKVIAQLGPRAPLIHLKDPAHARMTCRLSAKASPIFRASSPLVAATSTGGSLSWIAVPPTWSRPSRRATPS